METRTGPSPAQRTGAWVVLLGFTLLWLGVAWDGQWHVDVGPDTFFTAPHLMFYLGAAMIGLTSLAVVLATTRDATAAAPSGRVVAVGRLRAPLAFLVTGSGSAGHLLYGATDLWWHTVYGFDILELTPSHIGLQLALQTQAGGLVLAFLALRSRRSGRWGAAVAGALFVASAAITLDGELFGFPLTLIGHGCGAVWVFGVLVGADLRYRWLVATGAAFLAVLAATMLFPPYATQVYADAIDLRQRDNALGLSIVGLTLPMVFPLVAAAVAAVVLAVRRKGFGPRGVMLAVGAVTAPAMAAQAVVSGGFGVGALADLAVVAVVGAGLCWFGWQSAALLRAPAVAGVAR
ncbi:hypothetical protein Val02_29720 [Virgisporangium aliadipatigenens]|uniref:Uncharacterized protein n=1 Tax=Virgisporangium aliadipatigenens TaxID=741659 RepID=A0A8J3YLI7_9ACTN|nr:hypothetical protein [Virgisporangium aliadipatigenens]GIJ46086.1 hypothetical protein Val02_29720 [Virgisporangium aliadipatigenens]